PPRRLLGVDRLVQEQPEPVVLRLPGVLGIVRGRKNIRCGWSGEQPSERDDHLRRRERQHSGGTSPVHAGTHRRRLGHQRSADVLSPRSGASNAAQRGSTAGAVRTRSYSSWICTATGDSCSTVLLTVQRRSWERCTALGNTSCAF